MEKNFRRMRRMEWMYTKFDKYVMTAEFCQFGSWIIFLHDRVAKAGIVFERR